VPNSHALLYTDVPAVDAWDAAGKRHDLRLARAPGAAMRHVADLRYAGEVTNVSLTEDPVSAALELLSVPAVMVGRPLVS